MSSTSYQGIYAVSTVLPFLSTVAVGLRFYARLKQNASLQFDDWAQLPALFLYISMAVIAIVGTALKAFGYPSPPTNPPDSSNTTILVEKLWFALQIIQIPALAIIKIAALRFYRRIFVTKHWSPLHIIIWILIGLTATWCIAFVLFYIFSCGNHFTAAWSGLLGFLMFCRTTEKFEESYAITDFLLDTFVLIVPLPSIWRLQISKIRKVGVSAIFLLALIGYAASIARLAVFVKLTKSSLGSAPPDIQTQDTQAAWFSMLEIGFAIIALNMPSLWIFFHRSSIESIVRSVRSILSLSSNDSRNARTRAEGTAQNHITNKSQATSTRSINNSLINGRQSNDAIELDSRMPTTNVETTVVSEDNHRNLLHGNTPSEMENGIWVAQSIDQQRT